MRGARWVCSLLNMPCRGQSSSPPIVRRLKCRAGGSWPCRPGIQELPRLLAHRGQKLEEPRRFGKVHAEPTRGGSEPGSGSGIPRDTGSKRTSGGAEQSGCRRCFRARETGRGRAGFCNAGVVTGCQTNCMLNVLRRPAEAPLQAAVDEVVRSPGVLPEEIAACNDHPPTIDEVEARKVRIRQGEHADLHPDA